MPIRYIGGKFVEYISVRVLTENEFKERFGCVPPAMREMPWLFGKEVVIERMTVRDTTVNLVHHFIRLPKTYVKYIDREEKQNKVVENKNMERELKIGDKVKIRNDLIVGNCYDGGCCYVEAMCKYHGVATITRIEFPTSCTRYVLDIDNGDWYWSPSMLNPVGGEKNCNVISDGCKKYAEELKDSIKSVQFNAKKGVTTIVLTNGAKGIARCSQGDEYDVDVGFALALTNALFGSRTQTHKYVNKCIEKQGNKENRKQKSKENKQQK